MAFLRDEASLKDDARGIKSWENVELKVIQDLQRENGEGKKTLMFELKNCKM